MTYLDESVSAFVLDVESGKFDNNRDKQHTRHLVSIKVVHFRVTPYSYGCGVLFICYWAFQSLTSDEPDDSTLSLLFNTFQGSKGKQTFLWVSVNLLREKSVKIPARW